MRIGTMLQYLVFEKFGEILKDLLVNVHFSGQW